MAYEIDLPDGSRGLIHDNVPRSKALEAAQRAYPDAFPPPPTALGQALNAPRNIARGVGSGLVQAVGGLSSLPYAAARYFNPEMTPFAETGFGKSIIETEQSLAPTDEGLGSQFAHGLGSFGSMLGPQAGLRGLGTVIKGVAPRAAAPVAVAQSAGLGAEEARQRVETARADGQTVTPGQEFGALAAGAPIGLTELLPIQNLFRATKGLNKPSDLASVLSYGKRALQQGAVEGVQEAGSGVIQDVIAQQIYNPNQEIGGSALKEGAMGAGVGGVAQVGLDLILRKDIRKAYQASLAKKDKEELDKAMQAAKDTADADAASRPKEKMAAAQDKHPIYNPLGNFSAQKQTVADDGTTTQSLGLNADHLAFINKTRAEAGKPLLKAFSVEDLSDAGMPQQEISKLIAEKTGFTPSDTDVANAPQHIAAVLNIAGQKNIDTDSQGFRDFLRRSTGTDDLNSMSPPQLFSAIKAVSALPISKTPLNLAGTSATRFSEEQYDVAIKNLNADHTEDNALSLADTIDKIKGYTGLKNDVDAESLLHTAAGRGDLYAKSYPNPDGTTNINVHIPNANKVAGGPDVRENTYASDSVPESYVIKTSQGDLEEHATEDKAWARIDTLSAARQGLAVRNTREAAKLGGQIAQSQTELDTMAAQGLTNTIEYQTKAAGLESKNQAKLAKIDSLNKAAENLAEPLTIEPRGEKITTKSDYTLYDNNEAAGTFDSREEAQAHAVSKLPDDTLRQIIAAAPNQKGDLAAELSVMAQDELKARYGSVEGILEPQMVGNTKAEERLLSAGLFTGRFKEQAAELEKKLRPMMTRLGLGDLHLNIVNAIRAGNEATADGEYSKRLIKIAIDAEKPMRVLRHEGIHALKELGAFSKDQWRVLENKAKSEWISKYKILERYQGLNLSPDALIEEAIADAFSDFDQTKPPAGLIGVVFNKIKSFMEALGNSLDGIGFHTADSIFGKVAAGRLRATREPTSMEVKNSAAKPKPAVTTTGAFSLRETLDNYGRRDWTKEDERNAIRKYPAEIKRIGDSFIKNKLGSNYGNYSEMNGRQEAAVDRLLAGVEKRVAASGLLTRFEVDETVRSLRDAARMSIQKIERADEDEFGPRNIRFLTEPWEKAKKEGEFISPYLGKDKEEGKFSLRETPEPKAKKEVKKRTTADLEKAIPPKDRVVSKDPTRLLNGEKFSSARLNDTGVGFLLYSIYGESKANEIIQSLWGESIKESGGGFAQNIVSQVNAKPPTAAFLNAAMSLPNSARYWYETSGEAGADLPLTPEHIELLFNILSATSQNAKPLTNAKRAISVMAEYLQNRPIETDLISKKPVQDAINNPHLETLKFGNFANTFKFVTGLTKTAPISTNDRQVAVVFGMEPEVFVKNPVLYEVISRFYNKVRDQQNALLEKGEQPYEAWQLQALTWVEQRGDNTSYGTETSDDYVQALHAITEVLKKEGIPLVRGKIGEKTLLDPRVPKILSGTLETFQNAMKATVESNTLLNTSGVMANAEYEKIENIQAPWANKLRKEFIQIQRRVLRKIASQKIVEDVVAAVVGGKVSMSRMDSTARGTYEDKLSPNMRIPMSYRDSKNAHHDLTDVESSAVLSILGNGLDQKAMAGSVFKPDKGGETFRVFIPGKIVSDTEASAFSADVGFPLNIYEVPNGGVIEINVGGRDDRPTKKSINAAYAKIFPNNKVIVTQTSIKTVYLEKAKNTYGVPHYNGAINDYRIRKFGRGDPSGLGRRFDADIYTATKKIRQLTTERNKEFRKFTKDAREQQAKAAAKVAGKKPPSGAPPSGAPPSGGKLSLRQTKTPEFKQWFGKSKQVNADGTPKRWYHGTSRDIGTFIPKQARAIFLAESPGFAEDFTRLSENYMAMAAFGVMIPTKRYDLMMAAVNKAVKDGDIGLKEAREIRLTLLMYTDDADTTLGEAASLMRGAEGALDSLLLEKLPSRANIMPLYVRAEKTFDYENPDHINIIKPAIEKRHTLFAYRYAPKPSGMNQQESDRYTKTQIKNDIANLEKGRWQSIEHEDIQKAIRDAGFDSFYVKEGGHKNLAVYSPNQVKSAVGNTGAFSRKNDDVRYSLKVDKMKATGSSKAWILFSEASKGINFANIKTLEKAGEAAEEHYKEQIKNIPEFDGKAYMEGLTIGDINAYPPDIQHAIQEYKAGNKSKGIQEILDTVASQRKANIKEWKQYIENINPAMEKDPFWRDYVISSLLKSMRTDKPDTGLPLNANALGQLYEKFKQGENINFAKGYQSALVDATKDLVELGDATTGWRKIPQTDRDDPKFDERVAAVQSLSCTGWCTRSTMAAPYIQQGDFWVYVDDKKPQVAIRFEGDQVQEIQGPQNDRSIPTKYINEITSLVDSGKIKNMTGQTKADITKAVRKSQFEAMIKEGVASGELVEKDRGYAKKNGIEVDEWYYGAQGTKVYVDADGGIVVNDDVSISEAAPNLKAVGGNAHIEGSAPKLTTVGGDANIEGSAPALTTVGGNAIIYSSVPALTTVGGNAIINEGASAPKLTTVGGDADISEGASARALTTVGGDANIYEGVSVPNIKRIGIGKEAALKGTALGKDDVRYSIRSNSAQTKPQGRWDEENSDLSPDMTAAINRTTTARKNEGWSDRIAAAFSPRSFTAFRQAFIHGADSISNLTRESALQFGEQEYHADRSAIAAVLFADRAAGIAASSFVNGPPVYKNGFASVPENSTVRGLIPILEPIMKGGAHMFQRFQFYAGTRRGSRLMYETRVGKDGKTITSTREQNFTKEDIERGKILEKMHPEFKQVFEEYQQYNNGLVQFMKDTGVISAKEAELWTKNWDYIPFYRQMDGDRINAPAIFSSISGVKKPKELKGGEAPLADFMETVIRNSRAAIEAGMKNVAGQRTIRDLLRLNQASEVPPATKGYDIVSIKQAGVTKFYKVDDSLVYEALKGLDAPHLPFVEILAKPANFLRDMVTKDPGFMLANLARDSMQAWVTSGVNMTPLFDTFKQAGKAMLGSNPEAAALARSGYFTGYDFAGDTKSSAAAVEKELRKRTGTQTGAEKALMPLSKIMDVLDKGAHISDLATRAEVYKRVLEETGSEAEATYQALEIMNFSRKGNSALIRIVTALVPFMNARIQGMDVLYRTGFGRSATVHNQKQKKLFATRSLTILGLTAMYLALAADTEEYKNATPEERDNYWILGGLGRIPIPFELGVLFKVFPERIYQHVWGMDTGADLRQSIARNITSTLVMNPIPHVAMPIIENVANYSFFTGQPIVGKGMEDVYTPYQLNPSTSLLAQLVGKETNQSPLKIDNLIRGYTGTLGTYAVMMLDAAMRGEGDDVKATKTLEQMPVFKRFMTTKQGSGTINAYYELKKEVDTAVKTVNFLERQGDYDELAVFQAGRGGKLLGIKDYIKGLDEEMSSLRTFRREARRSRMDPDSLAEIESNIKDAEINVTKNIQFVKKALD